MAAILSRPQFVKGIGRWADIYLFTAWSSPSCDRGNCLTSSLSVFTLNACLQNQCYLVRRILITSWNGNVFRINGPSWGGFPSQRATDRDVFFLCCWSEQVVEQIVEWVVIWDAITITCPHCNDMIVWVNAPRYMQIDKMKLPWWNPGWYCICECINTYMHNLCDTRWCISSYWLHGNPKITKTHRWLSARLQYLQCVSNGDTAVLR